MSRADFLNELEKLLSDIPEDERKDALSYYYDYLDGEDDAETEKRMAELGTPAELAQKIKLAAGDTHVVDGEFTETGYSDSADDERNVPDKYTQIAKSAKTVDDEKGEKKYNIFGVTVARSMLILIIILLLLIVPIFTKAGKKAFKAVTRIPRIITHVNGLDGLDELDDIASDIADKVTDSVAASSGDKAAEAGNASTNGKKTVIGEANEIKDIEIDAGAVALYIKKGSGSEISYECDDEVKFDGAIDSDTLKIRAERKNKHALDKEKKAILYLPNDMKVSDLKIEAGAVHIVSDVDLVCKELVINVGAGDIHMADMTCEKADLDVGAGELIFSKLVAEDADIDVDMGDFQMSGDITDKLDLDVAMGNATLKISSKETDHNYDYEVGMGNLDIGSRKISGMGNSDEMDNKASSDYDISVGMGNVTIKF